MLPTPELGAFRIPSKGEVEQGARPARINDLALNSDGHAHRLIQDHGHHLMLAHVRGDRRAVRSTTRIAGDGYDIYTLHERSGRWEPAGDTFRQWAGETITAFKLAVIEATWSNPARVVFGDTPAANANRFARAMEQLRADAEPAGIERMAKQIAPVWLNRLGLDLATYGMTVTTTDEIDADGRYVGCPNGIFDLHEGALLPPQEGRGAFVTASIADDYDPAADHPDTYRLFEHCDPDTAHDLLNDIAFSLYGAPKRRWRAMVSRENSAKTTILEAIDNSLGDYSRMMKSGAFAPSRRGGEGNAATPDMEGVMPPVRIAWFDEMEEARIDAARLKALVGGGKFTWRRLFSPLRTDAASATIFFMGNAFPKFGAGLEDTALADRFRGYELPQIPADAIDPGMVDYWKTSTPGSEARRQAIIAELFARAAQMNPNTPPAASAVTIEMSSALIRKDIGEAGTWLRDSVVKTGLDSDRLTTHALWQAACDALDYDTDKETVAGKKRSEFTQYARKMCSLPTTTTVIADQKAQKGWKGYAIVGADYDPENPELFA